MLSEARIDELLARARAGDGSAAGVLIGGLRERVFRWALVVTRDSDDAEDVTQQVSITLHRKLTDFEARSRFTTWLYAVVRNAALAQMQKARRQQESAVNNDQVMSSLPGSTEDRLTGIDNQRKAELVRRFLTELPARQRELIELVDVEGYTAVEAARMIDVEPVTARVHLLRARRAIRTRMLELHPEVFA